VKRWIRRNGDPRDADVDAIDWIELIPFDETRNYVQRSLESLNVYRRRLDDGSPPTLLIQDLNRGARTPSSSTSG
jgi:soluble lytic murein transglycosylase